jgi:hypothetical protein
VAVNANNQPSLQHDGTTPYLDRSHDTNTFSYPQVHVTLLFDFRTILDDDDGLATLFGHVAFLGERLVFSMYHTAVFVSLLFLCWRACICVGHDSLASSTRSCVLEDGFDVVGDEDGFPWFTYPFNAALFTHCRLASSSYV